MNAFSKPVRGPENQFLVHLKTVVWGLLELNHSMSYLPFCSCQVIRSIVPLHAVSTFVMLGKLLGVVMVIVIKKKKSNIHRTLSL